MMREYKYAIARNGEYGRGSWNKSATFKLARMTLYDEIRNQTGVEIKIAQISARTGELERLLKVTLPDGMAEMAQAEGK